MQSDLITRLILVALPIFQYTYGATDFWRCPRYGVKTFDVETGQNITVQITSKTISCVALFRPRGACGNMIVTPKCAGRVTWCTSSPTITTPGPTVSRTSHLQLLRDVTRRFHDWQPKALVAADAQEVDAFSRCTVHCRTGNYVP